MVGCNYHYAVAIFLKTEKYIGGLWAEAVAVDAVGQSVQTHKYGDAV